MPEPLKALVAAVDGKYIFINKGVADGVQVGDLFDSVRRLVIVDPVTKEVLDNDAMTISGTLYVERVFKRYSATVLLYSELVPWFNKGDEVQRGHPRRVVPTGAFLNSSK